jgi:serine phosphatase RsbU (regulator of sigma subunit)/putative methionine-R-sulfoxide reductase with GAF domain
VSRKLFLSIYAFVVGGIGWGWLLLSPTPTTPVILLLLFGAVALAVDLLSFRVPPADSHSLVGIVLLSAALSFGPVAAAMIAAIEGLLSGVLLLLIHRAAQTFYTFAARPLLRSGARAMGLLLGGTLAQTFAPDNQIALLVLLMVCYTLINQLARLGREYLQGGRNGLITWWRSAWPMILAVEFLPLPLALLGSAIMNRLGVGYFLLSGLSLIAAAAAVRRAAINLQSQGRSVRELALLNEVSRAIIRSELNIEALCDLIYRETTKIVDTSSFHLGLFEDGNYTLRVRVQDRVRLPVLNAPDGGEGGIIGWMRRTGRALLVEDFVEEMNRLPARPSYQSERPPRSGIYVPLIAGDAVIGSLSVQSYQSGAFDANDLRLLSLIADQAAVAITRARIFSEAQQRALQLQAVRDVSQRITAILNLDELLPSVVRLIRERFQYHPVHIFTVEPGSAKITFRASTAGEEQVYIMRTTPLVVGRGIVGTAVAGGKSVLVGDVRDDPRYIRDNSTTRSELAVPLRIGDTIIGVLDVQSDQANDFDTGDLFVMQTLADQIAVAIDSANSYTAQQEEAWTLNALLQVAENVGRAKTLDELLATMVRLLPLLVGPERCYCLLYERADDQFALLAAYGLNAAQRAELVGERFSANEAPLLDHVRMGGNDPNAPPRPMEVLDAQKYKNSFPQLIERCGSGTLVALPMLARANTLGVILLDYDDPHHALNGRQMSLCSGAAAQFASALESTLLAREAEEAARLEQELTVAREIQTALLPSAVPDIPGWQIGARWRSARLVGGDFYDFWPLPQRVATPAPASATNAGAGTQQSASLPAAPPTVQFHTAENEMGFVIADVSDKGVPAAMFMAMSRSLVRAAALDGSPPAHAMERANRWITRDSESGMFVTLFYGLIDTASGRLRYTCAGHNPPLIYRAASGAFEELHTPGIALGVLEEITLAEAVVVLEPNDLLIGYTDGVTEAINQQIEEFGTDSLRRVIASNHAAPAEAIVDAVIAALDQFSQGQPPFDDVTLVVIKRL